MDYQVYASGPRKGEPKLLRDRLIRYLTEGLGMTVIDASPRSTKLATIDPKKFMWIGKNGSTRIGRIKTESQDVAQTITQKMMEWESSRA